MDQYHYGILTWGTHMAKFFRKFEEADKMVIEVPFNLVQKDGTLVEDETHYYFEGYASTFGNVDSDDDVIAAGAFRKTLEFRKPKVLGHHDVRMPVGVHMEAKEDNNGLKVKGKIPKDGGNTPFIVPYLRDGVIDSLSIGFRIARDADGKYRYDIVDGVRIIKEVDLYEYSFVVFPANELATVSLTRRSTDLRMAEKDAPWDGEAARKRIQELPEEQHGNAYLVQGCKNSPLVADCVDGELWLNRRAVIQAAATLDEYDLSDEERAAAVEQLKSLYADMGMEVPTTLDMEFDNADIKKVNEQLRALGLSHKQSNALISRIKSLASTNDGGDDAELMEKALERLREHESGTAMEKRLADIHKTLNRK